MSKLEYFAVQAEQRGVSSVSPCNWCEAVAQDSDEIVSNGELCLEHRALSVEWSRGIGRIPPGREDQLDPLREEMRARGQAIYREKRGGGHAQTATA